MALLPPIPQKPTDRLETREQYERRRAAIAQCRNLADPRSFNIQVNLTSAKDYVRLNFNPQHDDGESEDEKLVLLRAALR
jgi:hypothetical protein